VPDKELKLPFYAKTTTLLVGFFALFTILYIGKSIIVPLVFATLIAILLSPIVNFLVRRRLHRIIAIGITLILTFLVIAAFGYVLIYQLNRFSESWPMLVEKFTGTLNQIISWASDNFEINPQKIHEWIAKTKGELINTNSALIGQTVISIGSGLVVLFIIPLYIFMILFYQPLLLDFIIKLFGENNQGQVREIVSKTKTVIQRYLIGLLIEAVLIATLDTAALLVLGIQYALLLGIIGALLNVIPYIGGLVAVALPMMIALATKSSPWFALYVLILYYIIQLIDNHYIVPIIVASKVRINALFAVIVVLVGNALWGISGMFLSIPLLAIVKLICDHIDALKPWGFLLGDTMPPILGIKPLIDIKPILKIIKKKL
jgi:predicted PurR-regulated permease PerM